MNRKTYLKLFVSLSMMLAIIFSVNLKRLIAEPDIGELFTDKESVRVTMDLQEASLRDVLKMLSVQSGLNFIASEAVADRKLTLYLDNVPIRDAMDKIFKVNNLTYDLDTESNIFIVKDWGKPEIELDTRVYFLKYIRVTNSLLNRGLVSSSLTSSGSTAGTASSGLTAGTASSGLTAGTASSGSTAGTASSASVTNGLRDALDMVSSEYGKLIEDPATNSIIITDMPSKFAVIEQLITKLDVPIPQVMIEVEVLDVDKSEVDKLGLKFSGTDWLKYSGPDFGSVFPFNGASLYKGLVGKTGATQASWNMSGLSFAFDFLSTRITTKFLARPKLFVLNNETAELRLTSNEAIGSSTITQGQGTASTTNSTAERAETGVILQVTPQISMATGEITMILNPTVREAIDSSISLGTQTLKDVEERSVKSTVRIKDGETIIIGGLIRQKNPITITKVPFFGDIPILGLFFRHRTTAGTKDREILVFITPKIVKSPRDFAGEGRQLSARMLGERKQDDFISGERIEAVSQALGMYEGKYIAK